MNEPIRPVCTYDQDENGLWCCHFRGLTGKGVTPHEAYLSLVEIEKRMLAPWPAMAPALH